MKTCSDGTIWLRKKTKDGGGETSLYSAGGLYFITCCLVLKIPSCLRTAHIFSLGLFSFRLIWWVATKSTIFRVFMDRRRFLKPSHNKTAHTYFPKSFYFAAAFGQANTQQNCAHIVFWYRFYFLTLFVGIRNIYNVPTVHGSEACFFFLKEVHKQ